MPDLEKIVESCNYLLKDCPLAEECRDYLDSRLSKTSQDVFQFGYFPNTQNLSILTSLVGEQTLIDNKLLYIKEIEDCSGPRIINFNSFEEYPLVMPFKDPYGKVVAIVGRTLLSEEDRKSKNIAKYKNTVFHKGNYLYGLYEHKKDILSQDHVYVVEGQIDVIKSSEIGMRNIVALGSSNMSYYQLCLILRYTKTIFLLLDNDESGQKGRKTIFTKFSKYANIVNAYVPDPYKDIDEYISTTKITNRNDVSLNIEFKYDK